MTGKLQQNTKIDRKEYLQYAINSTTANRMSDETFLDCAAFISQQINVNDMEQVRKTLDTNVKNKENMTIQDRIKTYANLLLALLFVGLFSFIVISICYAVLYMKRNTAVSTTNAHLLLMIFGIGMLFLTFVFLYYMIMIQSKKIMLLL